MPNFSILFGAGASYGSDTSGTPPLGADLFDALKIFNPEGWGALSGDLGDLFRDDFEAGMSHLSEEHSHDMPVLQRAMAAYFFQFIPRTSNLYISLANRIRQNQPWEGVLVTLNYERYLEISLGRAGIRPVVNAESTSETDIELCFPHGCCHLFCESVRGTARDISISGISIRTSGNIIPIIDPDLFNQRILSDAFPPVMSYFEPRKRTLSGVNFIDSQRQRWCDIVNQASIIALVGIKVRPHDDHIWGLLTDTAAKLIYCAGSESAIKFVEWGYAPHFSYHFKDYFSLASQQNNKPFFRLEYTP